MKIRSVLVSIIFSLFVIWPLSAFSAADSLKETVIENGLTVFTLEDFSSPLVRIEVCVRSGFSSQNIQNNGFAKLLTGLIEKSSRLNFQSAECGADSIRFVMTISPSEISETFDELSESIFNPAFTDSLVAAELASMKREVLLNASEAGTLINGSIDSRIFSAEPWRNDSGLYPALFNSISENDARKILSDFHDAYFFPGNAAVFISGNIKDKNIIENVQRTFGRYYSHKKVNFKPLAVTPVTEKAKAKFVIHGKDFSEELTQVVYQYGNFSEAENILASIVYNNDYSQMKQVLCDEGKLNIPGTEYINVSAASKSGSSRLIIQSLLQNVKNVSPVTQTELFLSLVKKSTAITYADYDAALSKLRYNYNKTISSSSLFMNELCGVWAGLPYDVWTDSGSLYERMQEKLEVVENTNAEVIGLKVEASEPFVFVILNTKQYTKYKKEFSKAGYTEVNSQNGSWYTDKLYKNVKELMKTSRQEQNVKKSEAPDYVKNYIDESRETIVEHTLSNGIPLVIKQNKNTTGVTFLLSIEGGNLRTAKDHGFEEVMTNILTMNILRQISVRQYDGLILNDFEINSQTDLTSSRIIVECETDDLYPVVNALYSSMVMDEVIPTDADRIVSGRKTRKRLENGSTMNQLYSAAVQTLFPKSVYSNIYETQKEILESTNYEKILENYPAVLDASRYSLMLSGNIEAKNYIQMMEDAFGQLMVMKKKPSAVQIPSMKEFPSGKQQKVKIVHTFLTDVPAKDAGPMPAVLVPTKSFADPILYCVQGASNKEALNALLVYFKDQMNEGIGEKNFLQNCKVGYYQASNALPFGAISFSSVERTSACDNLYKETYEKIRKDLANPASTVKTLDKIKTALIREKFMDANTNSGAAVLMYEGVQENNDAAAYLETYKRINEIKADELLTLLDENLAFEKLFKLYSSDAKK